MISLSSSSSLSISLGRPRTKMTTAASINTFKEIIFGAVYRLLITINSQRNIKFFFFTRYDLSKSTERRKETFPFSVVGSTAAWRAVAFFSVLLFDVCCRCLSRMLEIEQLLRRQQKAGHGLTNLSFTGLKQRFRATLLRVGIFEMRF